MARIAWGSTKAYADANSTEEAIIITEVAMPARRTMDIRQTPQKQNLAREKRTLAGSQSLTLFAFFDLNRCLDTLAISGNGFAIACHRLLCDSYDSASNSPRCGLQQCFVR